VQVVISIATIPQVKGPGIQAQAQPGAPLTLPSSSSAAQCSSWWGTAKGSARISTLLSSLNL